MSEKIRKNIMRIILLLVIVYCSYILYNTKIKSVQEQNRELLKLEQRIENKDNKNEVKTSVDLSEIDLNIVGALYIPKINLRLPVYDSTVEDAIRKGIGILETTGTLKPKNNQDIVLTTHNGDDKRDLFMNLNKLEVGDSFYTKDIDNNIVEYKVDDINKVLPTEIFDSLTYDKEKSRATLMTCTPVGINSHRLLVSGREVNSDNNITVERRKEIEEKINTKKIVFSNYEIMIITLLVISLILFVLSFFEKKSKKKGEENIEK